MGKEIVDDKNSNQQINDDTENPFNLLKLYHPNLVDKHYFVENSRLQYLQEKYYKKSTGWYIKDDLEKWEVHNYHDNIPRVLSDHQLLYNGLIQGIYSIEVFCQLKKPLMVLKCHYT